MTNKPVEIPIAVTIVDTETGKEDHQPMSWKMLPPSKDKCQICAAKHVPAEPHNAQSIYYQMAFQGMVGRSPTWADAIAHCAEHTRKQWKDQLQRMGAWTEPPEGEAPVRHH